MKKSLTHVCMSVLLAFTVGLSAGCAGQIPTLSELETKLKERDASIDALLKRMNLDGEQTKELIKLLQDAQNAKTASGVGTVSSSQESILLQRLTDLEAKKDELQSQLNSLNDRYTDVQSRISGTTSVQMNNSEYSDIYSRLSSLEGQQSSLRDSVNTISGTNSNLSAQLSTLLEEKASIEARISDQAAQLLELDKKNQDFIAKNKESIDALFAGIEVLKLSNQTLTNDQLATAKLLESHMEKMNNVLDTLFKYQKTASDENQEQHELFQQVIAKSTVRVDIMNVTNAASPRVVGYGSANLILKVGDKYVFSTAAHVSRDAYMSQRGYGTSKYALGITPVKANTVHDVASNPVIFDYQDEEKTQFLVTNRYAELTAQVETYWSQIDSMILELMNRYIPIYEKSKGLSFFDQIGLSDLEGADIDSVITSVYMLQYALTSRADTMSDADKAIADELNTLCNEFIAKLNSIYTVFDQISATEENIISQDVAFVVIKDTLGQFSGLKPLLTLENGILKPQTMLVGGKEIMLPFDIRTMFSDAKGSSVGVLSRIFACGVPFDSLERDIMDKEGSYNNTQQYLAETDIWGEEKQITRVHQPKPNDKPYGSKKAIPSYLQVSGSMNGGSSGGLNYSVDSYRSDVLVNDRDQLILTKEGQKILKGYDNTLKTPDAMPVYLAKDGRFTIIVSNTMPVTFAGNTLSVSSGTIQGNFSWRNAKTITGLGVNSFGVVDFFTTVSSNIASFAPVAKELTKKLERKLKVELPSVYDEKTSFSIK